MVAGDGSSGVERGVRPCSRRRRVHRAQPQRRQGVEHRRRDRRAGSERTVLLRLQESATSCSRKWGYTIEATDAGCRVTEYSQDLRPEEVKAGGAAISGVEDRLTHNRAGMEKTLERLAAALEG